MCIAVFLFHSSINLRAQAPIQIANVPVVFQAKYNRHACSAFTAAYNTFLIPYINGFAAGVYTEKKFLTDHINTITVAACTSFSNGGVSVLLQQFGNMDYVERTAGLAYAKQISRLTTAVEFKFLSVGITGADNVSSLHTAVSALWDVNTDVNIVMKIADPPFFQSKTRIVSSTVTFGGGWQITPTFYAGFETCKQELQPLLLTAALDYKHSETISIGFSWAISTNQPCASISWNMKRMKVQSGAAYHPVLGPTPFAAFAIEKRRNQMD